MCDCCLPASVWTRQSDVENLRRRLQRAVANCRNELVLGAALEILEDNATEYFQKVTRRRKVLKHGQTWSEVTDTLRSLNKSSGKFGIDIGGSLAKCALMQRHGCECHIPETFGESGRRHQDLAFRTRKRGVGAEYDMHFISGHTDRLHQLLQETKKLPEQEHLVVVAAGGGAHRFAGAMREVLNVEMLPFSEMQSLVGGLNFLHEHSPEDELFILDQIGSPVRAEWPKPLFPCLLVSCGSGVSILRLDEPGRKRTSTDTQASPASFTRVGGTACGGATFLGLVRLLTSATCFDEAVALAESGNSMLVNKLVSDIYGEEGSKSLGLPGNLVAAYFGKLATSGPERPDVAEADVAAALMTMVVQGIVLLAVALAKQCNTEIATQRKRHLSSSRLPPIPSDDSDSTRGSFCSVGSLGDDDVTLARAMPIFFAGGFLDGNPMAQRLISTTFRRLGLEPAPLFLRHADFLGALGSVASTL